MTAPARPAESAAYTVLAAEHRLIERGLDLLERVCEESRRSKTLDPLLANGLLRFLREFADAAHHLKEERVLFPAIEANGFFPGCGLVSEHQAGRARVQAMAAAVERVSAGDVEARRIFVQQARSYINLLRSHIAKEDDCLASVCARTFTSEDALNVAKEFEELERREIGEGAFERFAALLDALEARLCADRPGAIA